jgi:hypothetical protein
MTKFEAIISLWVFVQIAYMAWSVIRAEGRMALKKHHEHEVRIARDNYCTARIESDAYRERLHAEGKVRADLMSEIGNLKSRLADAKKEKAKA